MAISQYKETPAPSNALAFRFFVPLSGGMIQTTVQSGQFSVSLINDRDACPNCGDVGGDLVERYDDGDPGAGYSGGFETCCTLCVRGGVR